LDFGYFNSQTAVFLKVCVIMTHEHHRER
jgi:hypothetical protein